MTNQEITIKYTDQKKEKPDDNNLQFGATLTDHMFTMDYIEGQGWHNAKIVPYSPLEIDPAALVFHYGQTVFEGLKAYLTSDGKAQLFRPEKNIARLNQSSKRLCMPAIDVDVALQAIKELVAVEKEWIPKSEGTSLYIRPFIIATQPSLNIIPSSTYQFIIVLSPVGSYYKEGINPVKIAVENKYVRAVSGGTGEAKTAGNYAASLMAQQIVEEKGFSQVLWLDGVERRYIEEVGSMNIFFKINGEVITPSLEGSILPGVTRDSVIKMLKFWDIPVSERKITIQEVYDAHQNGLLEEVFGSGTAAVISPVGQLTWENEDLIINRGETGELSKKLYDTLTGIQYGRMEDPFEWIQKID